MKKLAFVISGLIILIPPIFSDGLEDVQIGNLSNLLSSKPHLDYSGSFSIEDNLEEPDGKIGNVTYYGKREGKKEILDIFLDSQTARTPDYCFMMVSVYSSQEDLEYRLDTTIVRFIGKTHYVIELDPPELENETYRTVKIAVEFYSNEEQSNQFMKFDIPYCEQKKYTYENDINFTSSYPVAIRYFLDGTVEKIYEEFNFNAICNLTNHKPIFDIKKLSFNYGYDDCEIFIPNYDECYLLIADVYDNSDLDEENEMKKVPLNLKSENGVVQFELANSYYYDSSDGMIYQNNKTGRSEINSLILPLTYSGNNESIYYELHFTDFSSSGDELIFKSYASFDVKWFGSCIDSYFCVDSKDDFLSDVYYSGGVTI